MTPIYAYYRLKIACQLLKLQSLLIPSGTILLTCSIPTATDSAMAISTFRMLYSSSQDVALGLDPLVEKLVFGISGLIGHGIAF